MLKLTTDQRNIAKGVAFTSPWIIGFLTFTLLPVVMSLYYSFCDYPVLKPPLYIGLENYKTLAHDPIFWQSLRNTALYAVVALPLGLICALGVALLLNRKISGQSIYRTIVFLPSLIPAVASAMLWLWLFNGQLGLINGLIRRLHLGQGPNWLGSPTWAMPALIFMSLWGVGNTVVIYLAGLQDVPRELYEAADIDGASPIRQLWHVTLPGISPVIFFNLVMAIIGTLQVFTVPQIMFPGGGPDRSVNFYTMYVYQNAFNFTKMGYASAMAWVQLLIILALTALATWTSKKWVHL
jgi:multiple sugar transport system permease protein